MLSFQEFFKNCSGSWSTERTYHSPLENDIERSHTEYNVRSLEDSEKEKIIAAIDTSTGSYAGMKFDLSTLRQHQEFWPGFAIAFNTLSERGEQVSMSLKALFIPDRFVEPGETFVMPPLPIAAQVKEVPEGELIQGFYLRDEGYSESGAIAGRFTYQPARQTLEMLTYYRRSVALDQMRFILPSTRLRTIITYRRPEAHEPPEVISLIGFGVEQKVA